MFAFKPRPDLDQELYLPKNLESVFAEIIVPNKPNIIIGTIYRHPCMSINSFNSDYLKPFLHIISSENKQTILLGDFNINLLNADDNLESSNFLDILGSNLIVPQILLPTRIAKESKTLIDNVFSSITEFGAESGNLCYSISDHLPQFCLFRSPHSGNVEKRDVFKKDWSKFDQEKFILDYREIDWNATFEVSDNPDQCFDVFNSKLKVLLDRHIPSVKLTKRQIKTKAKPWITAGILKSITKRDFYLRKFIKAKNPEIKTELHNTFKSYCNLIVTLCRRSKTNYYTGYFNQFSADMRKTWSGVRELISGKSKSSSPISISTGNSISSEPEIVANSFNDFFTSIADSIRSAIPPTRDHFSRFLKNRKLYFSITHFSR